MTRHLYSLASLSPGSLMAKIKNELSIAHLCLTSLNCMILLREKGRTMAMKLDRISITYDMTFETPFHCGTGLRAGLIDRTIVRDHDGYLYVPGSTIKGVVR